MSSNWISSLLQVTARLFIATEWPEMLCFNSISACYCGNETYFMRKTFVLQVCPWEVKVAYLELAFKDKQDQYQLLCKGAVTNHTLVSKGQK